MRPSGDISPDMLGTLLDRDTADRLLAGRLDPDDAPPGYEDLARAVDALRAPARADELGREPAAVAAAIRVLVTPVPHRPRLTWRGHLARAKIAGLVVAGTLVGTTGLAAANVLPDRAQDVVADALSRVGIQVPHSTDASAADATVQPSETPTSGADASEHPASTGAEISQIARTTDATGVAKGTEISTAASGGTSRAGQNGGQGSGSAGGNAPVDTPNGGGTGTADQASGGKSSAGTDTADDASGGHSSGGSGNAPGQPSTP